MNRLQKNNSGYKGALKAAVCGYAMVAAVGSSAMAQHNAALEPVQVAQSAAPTDPVALDRITVKGDVLSPRNAAFSSTTFDKEQIRDQQVTRLQEMFKFVPGMELRNFQLGGVADAITLRGFANGGHGGDIGLVIDGIPLNEATSHADGYADLNVVVPLEIGQMTVFRGPVSALYGNFNRGGVIELRSRKGGEYLETDVSAGTFKTIDAQGAAGFRAGPAAVNLAAQAYRTDGFRAQSDYDRQNVSARASFGLGSNSEIAFAARHHSSDWDSASYILQPQFNSDRIYDKDPRVQNDGGDKDFSTGRVDYATALGSDLQLGAFGYTTQQTFTRFFTRPVSANPAVPWKQREEDYDRRVYGYGLNLSGRPQLLSHALRYIVGVEAYQERTDFIFNDGLSNRQLTLASVMTEQRQNRRYDFDTASAFFQGEWELSPYFRPTLGVRYDRFTGDCSVRGPETRGDPCASMNDYDRVSPKVGVRSSVSDSVDLRASYAEGFQLPNVVQRFTPGGAVEPTTFDQIEVGAQFRPSADFLIDVALFRIDSKDEIFLADAATLRFANLGKTRREGVESEIRWTPWSSLELSAALSYFDSEVLQSANPALVGKRVPGTPRTQATVQGTYRFAGGWGVRATQRHLGSYEVNDTNTIDYGGYNLLDLGVFYERLAGRIKQRYYATVSNVFDRAYATTTLVLGGQRALSPGAPIGIMVGASLNF